MPPAENKKPQDADRPAQPNVGETARVGQGARGNRGRDEERDDERDERDERDDEPTFAEERMSNKDLAARLRDVENQLAATRAGLPLTLVPEHGAGPGLDVNETWSQYDQEQHGTTELPNH